VILAVSTSSPWASAALCKWSGAVLASESEHAPMAAGQALMGICERLLATLPNGLEDVEAVIADVGPGSFTGVRVGVTFAKAVAWAQSLPVAGVDSFDLIDPAGLVAVPCRKKQYLLREPGQEPSVVDAPPPGCVGYGETFALPRHPDAANVCKVLAKLELTDPERLVPRYVLEPGISTPRRPYGSGLGPG
jgi:hypothetical protein